MSKIRFPVTKATGRSQDYRTQDQKVQFKDMNLMKRIGSAGKWKMFCEEARALSYKRQRRLSVLLICCCIEIFCSFIDYFALVQALVITLGERQGAAHT